MDQNDIEMTLLRAEVENLRFVISTQAQQESIAIKWFGTVGTLLATVFVVLMAISFYNGYDSTKRIEVNAKEILSRAEKRLENCWASQSLQQLGLITGMVIDQDN